MRCPRCRRQFNLLAFKPFKMPRAFARDLTRVYQCPRNKVSTEGEHGCGFIFAPAEPPPSVVEEEQEAA